MSTEIVTDHLATKSEEVTSEILTIDVDAHLQKLAANTYQSPHHYPVELIRSALKRGADLVEVTVKKDHLEVTDNGAGISPRQLDTLCNLYDHRKSTDIREHAISFFHDDQGIDLLAVFAPSPQRIIVENVSGSKTYHLLLEDGKVQKTNTCGIDSGTRILVFREKGDPVSEKRIIRSYCRFVQKEVLLNGRLLEKQTAPLNALATLKLTPRTGIQWGTLWIPKTGDGCRIWLLNQGIPWTYRTFPPWKGYLFEMAVEFSGKVTPQFFQKIQPDILRIYAWLAEKYFSFPGHHQKRIEELIFRHYQMTGDRSLINQFSPFRTLHPPTQFNLKQIQDKESSETIYAIPSHDIPGRYNTKGRTVLSLNPYQADFLLNYMRMEIVFLSPIHVHQNRFKRFIGLVKGFAKRLFSTISTGPRHAIEVHLLTAGERLFLSTLTDYLSRDPHPGMPVNATVEPLMTHSRGILPVLGVTEKSLDTKTPMVQLFFRREHPLVKRAIYAVQMDPENIEWLIPLLIR